ncbi:hypothetical protein QQZ08_006413 [Neonectria magnoliae]|uniref:Rhomboid family membrane protein n=1 Tax=Neonectria magnoliae TaxID=2732573 RepID=A0ABR1I258_9HYPO
MESAEKKSIDGSIVIRLNATKLDKRDIHQETKPAVIRNGPIRPIRVPKVATTRSPSMSQDDAPPLPPRNAFIHNSAIAGAIILPIVMALPPRKMDIRFFVLAGAFSLATNQLAYEYTGQSIYGRFGSRVGSLVGTELPDGAKRTQKLLREHREREAAEKKREAENKQGLAKVLNDTWMGGEGENWREKRAEEHRKKFEEGKGFGDIIMDQVSDVWNGNWGSGAKRQDDNPTPKENK